MALDCLLDVSRSDSALAFPVSTQERALSSRALPANICVKVSSVSLTIDGPQAFENYLAGTRRL